MYTTEKFGCLCVPRRLAQLYTAHLLASALRPLGYAGIAGALQAPQAEVQARAAFRRLSPAPRPTAARLGALCAPERSGWTGRGQVAVGVPA